MHPAARFPPDPRLTRWEARADVVLTVAAVAFLVCYATPILFPQLPAPWPRVLRVANTAIWLFFAADYVVRIVVARRHLHYVRTHLLDLAIVALPFFQPLRLLRLVALFRVLNRRATATLRGRVAQYVGGASVIVVFVSALAVLDVERAAPGSRLDSFSDALWWAFVTVTTVGYGDIAPVTLTGRVLAVGLMMFGIALLGTVTGMLASWLVEKISDDGAPGAREDAAALLDEVRALRTEVAALREHLPAVRADPGR